MNIPLAVLLVFTIVASSMLGSTAGFSLRVYPAFRDGNSPMRGSSSVADQVRRPQVFQVVPQVTQENKPEAEVQNGSPDLEQEKEAQLDTPVVPRTGNGGFFPSLSRMTAINAPGRMNYASLSRNVLLEPIESYRSTVPQQLPIATNNPGPLLNCSTYLECKAQLLTYLDLMSKMHKKG